MAALCVESGVSTYSKSLLAKIKERIEHKNKFFSLEFFPPRTPSGTCNLFEKCDRLSRGKPLFCDVTCNISKEDNDSSQHFVEVASTAQDITQCDTMLQLNASQLTEERALELLWKAKKFGLSTVMAISDVGSSSKRFDDFSSTSDLIYFIRENFHDFFTICIAGYPSSLSNDTVPYEQTFDHLCEDVRAGADFIITQMVFEASDFLTFVDKCNSNGITVPIIPGVLPIQSYGCIQQLSRYSKVKIPEKIINVLNPIRKNDEAVLKYGIYLTVELCKVLLSSMLCVGLHFFTLNREIATTEVLKRIGLWQEPQINRRILPWLSDDTTVREGEEIRPIFWACRPGSYLYRTSKWEEFPNGRWGDSSLASFGSFNDYRLFFAKNEELVAELRKMWGEELNSVHDIYDVFVAFISRSSNKQGYPVTSIPWNEDDLAAETSVLTEQLVHINSHGFLTINSQPNVDCVASTNKLFGWGSPGGYVFQKAYLEFFCCEEDAQNLLEVLKDYPVVGYHFVNAAGTKNFTNTNTKDSNAVTWGVFTGKMVLQPTVVDPIAFQFWKDEAFELWLQQWGRLYDHSSTSWKIIKHLHDTLYLVNLVDNDYVKGNCLFEIVNRVISMRTNKEDIVL
ncbi:methylenetetrahydrofolate reductase (NADPH)-like isoform X1 [Hydractinia symbiolongicarpus]|uniref:methylenetetrahydrofolate reductase (NADPH)-like isoform X1 n=1 Tax=Hydractinia symbiolongicarpus TaxID=13093 RepID=UPI00254B6D7E|nr:methylenetetrahydrofolate reductase (NADPH)-like isoform X1 [Hydractinia symbiolongicarpus]XP_057296003.1 methylenetetrahydrofolate reductase (NADPH)-like isoform X1 [Hydractinia symbiolongicarpus]